MGARTVAVAQVNVVPHADLVTVVDDRRAGKGEQNAVEVLDAAPVVSQDRRQPASYRYVHAHPRIGAVREVHAVALVVAHHLERELIMVTQSPVVRDEPRETTDADRRCG